MSHKDMYNMRGHVIIPNENKEALLYATESTNEVEPTIILQEEPYEKDKSRIEIGFTSVMGAFYVGRLYERALMESQLKTSKIIMKQNEELTGDNIPIKKITLEKDSGFVKVGNDPNKTLYIPKGVMKKHVEQDKSE